MISTDELSGHAVLRRATMHLARRLRHERSAGALSGAKLSVLGTLYRRGEVTPGVLAELDRIQPQSLTRTLAALEAERLVYRRRDTTDRRRSWVGLTDAGLTALSADMAERDRWLGSRLEQLTPAERALLAVAADLLEQIADDESSS